MKGLSRRRFMQTAAKAAAAIGIASTPSVSPAKSASSITGGSTRPNILFIAIDDMGTKVSAFTDPEVKTPHIKALARRGAAFDHAYCQFPLCNPSRTSVMTSLRPETSGVLTNEVYWRDQVPDALDLPQHLANHGYDTVAIGKIFHAMQRRNQDAGWTRVIRSTGLSDGKLGKGRALDGILRDAIRAGRKPPPMAQFYQWGPSGLDGTDMVDGRFASQAVRFLGQPHERPFFLAVGFHNPHLPFAAPDRFFEMYPPETVPIPEARSDNAEDLPPFVRNAIPRDLMGREITPELVRTLNRAYRACCSHVDDCIGQVLDALRKNDLEKNTIVVLWSDHGFLLGEHGMWGKNCLFEQACRVPLIIAAPGQGYVSGRRCDALVELVDVFPTLSELCELPVPVALEGASLAPLLRNPERKWRQTAFSVAKRGSIVGRSVRTKRWRYTEYTDGSAELYDYDAATAEHENLIGKSEHKAVVARLGKLLHAKP